MEAWLPVLTGIVGIVGTWVAFKYNPKRILEERLNDCTAKIKEWEAIQNEALKTNDADSLTLSSGMLRELRRTQESLLLQR